MKLLIQCPSWNITVMCMCFMYFLVRLGVILDAWMYTLKDEPDMPGSIKQPLIFINTETFHIDSNIATMRKFVDSPADSERHLYTIR